MYEIGQYVIFGCEGVCRVEEIGPLDMKGAQKGMDYYTLTSLYQHSKLYAPVGVEGNSRPILTKEEAAQLIEDIPNIPVELPQNCNPRVLGEYYQTCLKSNDCRRLVQLIRAIHHKRGELAAKGRRLGQVDERSFRQAEDKLHGELAVSLDIPVDEVRAYIQRRLEASK